MEKTRERIQSTKRVNITLDYETILLLKQHGIKVHKSTGELSALIRFLIRSYLTAHPIKRKLCFNR